MGNNTGRFSRTRRGFMTLWALLFLTSMVILLQLILVGQGAQHHLTRRLISQYEQGTTRYSPKARPSGDAATFDRPASLARQ